MKEYFSLQNIFKQDFTDKKVVLAGGSFDIINHGHINFLKKCKDLGDILIIGLASDQEIKNRKGQERPINPALYRAKVLSSIRTVDYVFITNSSAYSSKIIRKIRPDVVALPLEYGKFQRRREHKKQLELEFPNINIKLTKSASRISTTKVIAKIVNRYNSDKT